MLMILLTYVYDICVRHTYICVRHMKYSLECRQCKDNATLHGEKKSPRCNNVQLYNVQLLIRESSDKLHQRQQSQDCPYYYCYMLSQVLKMSASGTDTGSQALTPFVDCAINDVLLQPLPHVNQLLLQVGYVTDFRL